MMGIIHGVNNSDKVIPVRVDDDGRIATPGIGGVIRQQAIVVPLAAGYNWIGVATVPAGETHVITGACLQTVSATINFFILTVGNNPVIGRVAQGIPTAGTWTTTYLLNIVLAETEYLALHLYTATAGDTGAIWVVGHKLA